MYKDWTNKASLTDCTEAELVTASDGYFTLDYHPIGQTEVTTVNGQVIYSEHASSKFFFLLKS
jgi:hypothetical protein